MLFTRMEYDDGQIYGYLSHTSANVSSYEDVERAIRALNGESHTFVALHAPDLEDEPEVIVFGGKGAYVCFGEFRHAEFRLGIPSTEVSNLERVVIRMEGTDTDCLRNHVVSLDVLLQAARTLCLEGKFDSRLSWITNAPAHYFTAPSAPT